MYNNPGKMPPEQTQQPQTRPDSQDAIREGQMSEPAMHNPGSPKSGLTAQPATAKKTGKALVIGVIVGIIALALVSVAIVSAILSKEAEPASTEPDKVTTPVAAVQGFLGSLAAGDADKAKQYAMNAPAESPLLTNEFLKTALAKSPITEIGLETQSLVGSAALITANYKLGATPVSGNYQLTKVGKLWRLNSIVTTVYRPDSWGALKVTINGTLAADTRLLLFPGVYEVSTGTPFVALASQSYTVYQPGGTDTGLSSSAPALTDVGKSQMVAKAQEWLTACLAVQDTNPKDCGMNTPLPDGATLAAGSIQRTLTATTKPFSDATPKLSSSDPLKITMVSEVPVKITAADTAGGTYSGTTSVTTAVGTIDGEKLTVLFTD